MGRKRSGCPFLSRVNLLALGIAVSMAGGCPKPLQAATVVEYVTDIAAPAVPTCIAAGPDGNLWFTEYVGNKIGKITTGGTVTEYSAGPSAGGLVRDIAAGPDGDLWFTEQGGDRTGRLADAPGLGPQASAVPAISTAGLSASILVLCVAGSVLLRS